jgi:hypothetical protein
MNQPNGNWQITSLCEYTTLICHQLVITSSKCRVPKRTMRFNDSDKHHLSAKFRNSTIHFDSVDEYKAIATNLVTKSRTWYKSIQNLIKQLELKKIASLSEIWKQSKPYFTRNLLVVRIRKCDFYSRTSASTFPCFQIIWYLDGSLESQCMQSWKDLWSIFILSTS